ncbi:glycerol kinase [Culex quinquefasciatus]|uniref:Glycerol kinase n=1 Tax=Culex quinquefasciatus TaxID=7176 RepID=B0XL11_CULQU|nr:glycerol kinase [Culex quinquefasciatus]|eukprot:XP_001870333.1 glycerol kinase [Culex quinquefasciatus]
MKKDCGINLNKLHADGIMTDNKLLMQLQADLGGIPVLKTEFRDPAALGTAMAAAQANGINPVRPGTGELERPTPRNNPRNVPAHDDGRGAGRAVHQVEDGRPAQPGLGRDQEERGHDRRAIRAAGVDSGQFVPAVVVCDVGVLPGQPEVIDFVNVILNVVTAFF